ncbi:MAG: hypothetical protein V4549_06440 [Bacteroidota bacterium]
MEESKTILDWFIPMMIVIVFATCAIWHPYTNENKVEYEKQRKRFFWIVIVEFAAFIAGMAFEYIRLRN